MKKKKSKRNNKRKCERAIWNKNKKTLELRTETIEFASSKLICDLNIEKGLEMKIIKKIEIRLKKLKIRKEIIDTIKESLFTNLIREYYGFYEL